jgi:CHAT domain-containing protein
VSQAGRVVVSPDGVLWAVPFAALPGLAGGAWLGLEKPLTYAQSLTVLTSKGIEPKGGHTSALVVGDPKAGEGVGAFSFFGAPAPLPGARQEAVEVARLYGATPLLGDAATESEVRKRLPSAAVVHLATHGYLHPMRAMSSGLLLASAPRPANAPQLPSDDGTLQAWEIMRDIRLRADLVVLSACESGRGARIPGEGLIGLTRAAQYAGAKSIIAGQWAVSDESTARLMTTLHRGLRAGLAKDEALRKAMLEVERRDTSRQPYFWAAFALLGEGAAPLR